jgi:hypothetical protein
VAGTDVSLWHKADVELSLGNVRFWGKADIAPLYRISLARHISRRGISDVRSRENW